MVVRGWAGQPTPTELERLAEIGERPRTPYVEVARALDADVIDASFLADHGSTLARAAGRRLNLVEGQVLTAFAGRRRYRHIVAWADKIGLELALLLKLARGRKDLVLVSNWLAGPSKRPFLERLHVQSHLGTIIGYGSKQLEIVAERYGIPRDTLHLALQPVDEEFWQPVAREPSDFVCSVGCVSGYRDYATLVEAARGLPIRFELAVGSLILSDSGRRTRKAMFQKAIPPELLPPNVSYRFDVPATGLRELYADSLFVVIPLEDVDFDAGVTSITEAMAMGKAVITTRNPGQVDVLHDGVEGLYVPPHDPGALRDAITRLLDDPAEAARMGAAGRATVLERHRLDDYVRQVAGLVLDSP